MLTRVEGRPPRARLDYLRQMTADAVGMFLLSGIRERYQQAGENSEAVARGVDSTARLITRAAVIIIAVVERARTWGPARSTRENEVPAR
jgi:hypothetical protein